MQQLGGATCGNSKVACCPRSLLPTCSILFVTPCLGFALRVIPLNPPEFAAGLALFAAVPTTLGVGVSLVRSCGGNEGLALLLTVASNIIGIFSMVS
jgi:sodium/bile acid cotransporter 7